MMTSQLCERDNTIRNESGYRIRLEEIGFNQIDLKWGSYTTPMEQRLSFPAEKPAVISHFRLSDPARTAEGRARRFSEKPQHISEKQFVVYRAPAVSYELNVSPTKEKDCSFFELMLSEPFFEHLYTEESEFLLRFRETSSGNAPSLDFTAPMTPAMYGIIRDMHHSPYSGHLKGLFLEAKAIELFLLQVKQLDREGRKPASKLRPEDIQRLHVIHDFITTHFDQHFTITDLARKAGINQMKLKNGFRELFGTTVFGCLNDTRMNKAKQLLVEERLFVGEVSDRIGYKHPHHFSAAFKRKFGVLPGDLSK